MSATDRTVDPKSATDKGATRSMYRVAIASTIGTLLENYNFLIYGTAATLVFPKVFFPALGSVTGTVVSLATFSVAFIVRPLGSVLFGHLGDRIGRKQTLLYTLLLMGFSTALVGLMPLPKTIGVAAPIALVVLRVCQGLGEGGEWAVATLFATEHAGAARRGFWGMFPQLGSTLPIPLSSGTFLVTTLAMSPESFLAWGWRIPFVSSALLVLVGLYTRLRVSETPVFLTGSGPSRTTVPIVDAFRNQAGTILLSCGMFLPVFAVIYVSVTYLGSYATTSLGLPRTWVLGLSTAAGIVYPISVVIFGAFSDRLGRRRLIGIGLVLATVWSVVMFALLRPPSSPVVFGLVLALMMLIMGIVVGPIGAHASDLFSPNYRASAVGIAYNIAGVVGGGVAPVVATPITAKVGPIGVGVLLAVICVVATACVFRLPETWRRDTPAAKEADGSFYRS